jgi:hypothetical protein
LRLKVKVAEAMIYIAILNLELIKFLNFFSKVHINSIESIQNDIVWDRKSVKLPSGSIR